MRRERVRLASLCGRLLRVCLVKPGYMSIAKTKSDLPGLEGKDLDQDVDDTVKQATGKEPVPSGSTPNPD